MNKQCVNCPGATDHTTAECPVMVEASAPIDPIHSAMMLGMTPEPCEPIIEITRQAVTKLLDVVEFGDQLERVEKDRLVAFVKELLAEPQPELWAMHSVGPNELHPMISKEEAEKQAASLIALCKERFPDIPITVNVIPSPYSPFEHFEILAEELTEQVASLRQAVATGSTPAPVGVMPPEIPRALLGKIVDELFGGAIEDTSAIEDVYRVIAREYRAAPAVVNQQLTTAELTSVRCQCCTAEHPHNSYDAGFIAGSGMCQVCDAAMPPKDLPVAGIEEVEVVAYQSGKSGMCYGEPYGLEVAKPLMTVEQHRRILDALINTPHTDEWFAAVRLEAAHQIQRWGTDHDAGKQPADWFWLLGYLGQKAMAAQMAGDEQKAKHHTISSGAMLLNWFRAMVGDTNAMRPGIAQDQQEVLP